MSRCRPNPRRACGVLAVLGGLAATALAADPVTVTVTMPDGYRVQGDYARETEAVSDGNGRLIKMNAANGFDVVQDGPKFVIFSTHAGKGGKVDTDARRDAGLELTTKLKTRFNKAILPILDIRKQTEFSDKWLRTIETVTPDGGFQRINQQIVRLDAYSFLLDSPTDNLTQGYHTCEQNPAEVRRWLSIHPDLRDPPGAADPDRRLRIATFLKDVAAFDGTRQQAFWLRAARAELALLKKDAPAAWEAKATERFDALTDDLDKAEARVVVDGVEAAVACGRYDAARQFLKGFNPPTTDAREKTRLAALRATIESVQPQYDRTSQLLRAVIERESGMTAIVTAASVAGTAAAVFTPRPRLTPALATLLEAAAAVLGELHPDTAGRLELFHDLARQSEARRAKGQSPSEPSDALLAYAVSGWLKGKNGADRSVEGAVRTWNLRRLATDYLGGVTSDARAATLDAYRRANPQALAPDELVQVVTLMPPPAAADLRTPPWTAVPPAECDGVPGIVRLNTGALPDAPRGVDYLLRLPPEYHHGRSYPVVLALPSAAMPAERLVARLAEQAERNGYLLVAPEWTNTFGTGQYDFSGKDHHQALGPLRDVLRRFQADADRVYLFGMNEGAQFALDLGMAHPDHFAGLCGFNVNLPPPVYLEYWRNNQKLPTHFVIGELAGAFPNLRKVYEKWLPRGFPAMLTVYRGRGAEWFPAEVPRLFDWMGRKARVRGSGTLRLNTFTVEPWQVLRDGDDRYYWVGVAEGGTRYGNPLSNGIPNRIAPPPQFAADIGRNGVVAITQALGVKKFTIWLERDLIDWTKPVRVTVNGVAPNGYTPKLMTPDLRLMFEELHRTGDRKMLFLGKIDVNG